MSSRPPFPKDFEKLKELAREQDWDVVKTGGGHWKWTPPNGNKSVISGGTISDHRGLKNVVSHLAKAGLQPITPERFKPELPKDQTDYFKTPPSIKSMKTRALKPHELRDVVRKVLAQAENPMFANDLLARVQAHLPAVTQHILRQNLYSYAKTWVEKLPDERYRITEHRQKHGKKAKVFALPPQPASEEDLRALENALTALSELERVIKKHIDLTHQFGAMKKLLGGVTNEG